MFWEISQLKEEVQDLKSLVKSLMSKMKGGDGKTDVTLDSYLHEAGLEEANNAIEGLDEEPDTADGDDGKESKK